MSTDISPSDGECSNVFQTFRERGQQFRIFYGDKETTDAATLLVLDSSFNPPHLGHYTLIKKALEFYHGKSVQVLLLLSVNNADKAPQPAAFDKRMEMMCLMAAMLQKEGVSVSVGITVFGKYVDKNTALRHHYHPHGTIAYLMGFDTIIRIFDPKYYNPQLPSVALKEFMISTELCCLTREGDHAFEKQISYAKDISEAVYEPMIPRQWGSKINILMNDEKYGSISSSNIRTAISNGASLETLMDQLPLPIIHYISSQTEPLF